MSETLISKKDLLEVAQISYGQLYRWKRKKLIPDDWFIRKSTFTGQETFFPKEKILPRIEKIKYYKEDLSLNELASMFSPSPQEIEVSWNNVLHNQLLHDTTLQLFVTDLNEKAAFPMVVFMSIVDQALHKGLINRAEAKELFNILERYGTHFEDNPGEVMVLRKLGVTTFLILPAMTPVFFDDMQNIVTKYSIQEEMEKVSEQLIKGGKENE